MIQSNKSVCVVGLGYIGLPTASLLATKGFRVDGVDTNPSVVDALNQGEVIIHEPSLDILVKSAVGAGNLRAHLAPKPADIFVIAVPTPFQAGHKPDLSYVRAATNSVAKVLKKGDLVILESTSPVGTTENIVRWICESRPDLMLSGSTGDSPKINFFVAYCPERVLPGQILKELVENDRVVGGINSDSTRLAGDFYKQFVSGQILLTDCRTAEMSKLTENTFRDVNIALANELSVVCEKLGVDVWELISLANHHPRVKILKPGPGVGGHCIAVDPWFLVDACPEETKLIRAARMVNDSIPHFTVGRILEAMEPSTKTIALLGLSYKADVDDLRESPAVEVVRLLAEKTKLPLLVVEPYIEKLPNSLAAGNISLSSLSDALQGADLIVVLVDHKKFLEIDPSRLEGKTLVDTRGIWSGGPKTGR